MRNWQVERRKRTRHLIELGGRAAPHGVACLRGPALSPWLECQRLGPALPRASCKTFRLKSDAKAWDDDEEHALRHGAKAVSNFKLYDVFDKYAREHSHKKRGARWEIVRLEKLKRDPIAQIKLTDLKPIHFADWRDAQLCALAAGSVIREMQIMSVALNVARREWGWIDANPLSEVRKPPKAPARDRLVSRDEISKLLEVGLIVEENTPELFFGNPQHERTKNFLSQIA